MKTRRISRKQFLIRGLAVVGASVIAFDCGDGDNGGGSTGGAGGRAGTGGTSTGGATGGAGTGGGSTGGTSTGGGSTGGAMTGGGGQAGANGGAGGAAGSSAVNGGQGVGGGPVGGNGGGGKGGSAVGGSSQGGASGSACGGMTMIEADISENHGHVLRLSMTDILAGVEKCYNTSGTSGHNHYLTITAADFAALRNGGVVTKISCNGIDHQYVLSCAGGAPVASPPAECASQPNTGATSCLP